MEKQEIKSKWDDLARQLGAEVSLEAEQLVEASATVAADPETNESDAVAPAPRPQPVKRAAAGWDNLASEFGLPTPPPPVEPVAEAEVPKQQTDVEPRVAQRDERPRRQHTREQEEPRGRRHQSRRPERDVESVERPAAAELSPPRAEETHMPPPAEEPEERSRGAAVSLWHKIFGSPVDQSAKLSDVSKVHEESHQTASPAEEFPRARQFDDLDEPAAADASDFEGRDILDQLDAVEAASDDASVTDRKRRPRRRRRRRGGNEERSAKKDVGEHRRRRSRSDRPEREPSEPADDLMADEDELDSDLAADADTEDGEIDANGESTESVTRSKSTLQRSIPSWDEAIGYIVEVNMQSRSQRRQSPHSGSRSHSPRNRARGRHKK